MNSQMAISAENLRTQISGLPRYNLCHLPTPLEKLENLSRKLDLNLYIKRDDQTGLAMGGNKARKLEFIIADALSQGADSILTWAGVQSNWGRQVAAGARRAGIEPFLILFKRPGLPSAPDGNLLLDEICSADITLVELGEGLPIMHLDQVSRFVDSVVERARKARKRLYIAPIGGSLLEGSMYRPWGAIAYVNAMLELTEQAEAGTLAIDYLVFATSSGSTHAGLVAGAKLLASDATVVGVSVSETRQEVTRTVTAIANQTLLEFPANSFCEVREDELMVFDDYVGPGYGIPSRESMEAIRVVAGYEGILLDPVYTGKAMAKLLNLREEGYLETGANVVFLHTGGTPAIFPYRSSILEYFSSQARLPIDEAI